MESPIREIDVDNGSLKILQYSNFVKYLFADKRDSLFQTYLTILENCPLMPRKYDVFMEEVCAYIEFPMEDYKRIESEEKPGLGMRAIRTFLFFLKILRTRGFSIAAKMDSQDMLCDANGNIVFFTVQLCKLSENNPGTDTNPIVATLENLKEKLSIIPEELDNSLALAKKSGSVNFEILLKSLSGPNEIHDQNNVWLLRMEGENLMVMKDDEVVKCQIEFQLRNEAEIVICIGGELESLLVRKKCSAGKEYVHKEKQEDKNFIYYVLRSFFPSEKFTVGQVERIRLWEMELDTVYKKCRDPEQYRVEEKMTSKLQHSNFHTPKTYTVIEDSNDSLTYVFNENNENEILHECLKNFMNVCPFVPSAHGQFPTLSTKMEEKTDWGRASDENNKIQRVRVVITFVLLLIENNLTIVEDFSNYMILNRYSQLNISRFFCRIRFAPNNVLENLALLNAILYIDPPSDNFLNDLITQIRVNVDNKLPVTPALLHHPYFSQNGYNKFPTLVSCVKEGKLLVCLQGAKVFDLGKASHAHSQKFFDKWIWALEENVGFVSSKHLIEISKEKTGKFEVQILEDTSDSSEKSPSVPKELKLPVLGVLGGSVATFQPNSMLCRLRLDQNNELRRLEMSSRAKDKLLEYHRICPFLSPVIPSAEGEQYVLDLKYEVGKGNLRQRIKNLNRRQIIRVLRSLVISVIAMRNKKVGLTLYRPIRLTDMYLDEDNNLVIAIADVVFDDDRKVLFEIERNSLIATLNNFNGIMNCTLDHFSHYLEYIKILTSHSWELTNHELFTQLGENNYSAMFSFIKDDTLHCMQLKNKSVPPVVCKTKLENRNHFDMIIPSSDNENIYVKIIDVEDELYSKYGCFITDLCLGKELCGKYCIYYLDSNRFNYIQTFLHKHEDQLVKKVVIKRENSSRQLTFAGIPQLFMEKVFSFMTKFPMAKSMNWEEHSKSLVSTSEGLLKDKSYLQNLEQKYKVNLTRLMLYLMDKMPAHGLFLGEPLHTQDLSITDEGYLQATAFAFTATSMNHYDNVVKSLENLQSMFGHLQEFDQLIVSAKLYSSTEKLLELPFFVKGKLNANPRIAAMVCPSFLILVFGGETMLISYQNQKAILQEKIQINDTKYLLQVYPVDTFNKLELCLDQVAHYETSQKFVVLLNTLY